MEAGHSAHEERGHGPFWLEVAIAVVLGMTAVTTAYAAYQAGKNERSTVASYNEGIRDSSLSTGVLLEAEQTAGKDESVFLEYAKAAQQNDLSLAAYLLNDLMSPELKKAVLWWSRHSDKYQTPFVSADPYYKQTGFRLGNHLAGRSNQLFAQAKKTHKQANDYELVTVISAVALFLLGVAGVMRNLGLRLAFFLIGTVFFLVALVEALILSF
jgi:hypothetical protein